MDKRPDLQVAVSQLAVELLNQAPKRVRTKHGTEASKLSRLAGAKLGAADGERHEGLLEIIEGLEGLGFSSGSQMAVQSGMRYMERGDTGRT